MYLIHPGAQCSFLSKFSFNFLITKFFKVLILVLIFKKSDMVTLHHVYSFRLYRMQFYYILYVLFCESNNIVQLRDIHKKKTHKQY